MRWTALLLILSLGCQQDEAWYGPTRLAFGSWREGDDCIRVVPVLPGIDPACMVWELQLDGIIQDASGNCWHTPYIDCALPEGWSYDAASGFCSNTDVNTRANCCEVQP